MGAWAWGDKDGYFGNTMTEDDFFRKEDCAFFNRWWMRNSIHQFMK